MSHSAILQKYVAHPSKEIQTNKRLIDLPIKDKLLNVFRHECLNMALGVDVAELKWKPLGRTVSFSEGKLLQRLLTGPLTCAKMFNALLTLQVLSLS